MYEQTVYMDILVNITKFVMGKKDVGYGYAAQLRSPL